MEGSIGQGRVKTKKKNLRLFRTRALQVCGWWYDRDKGDRRDNLNLLLDRLVNLLILSFML